MAASNWGLIMNIVNSIVGVSVLTMPFCFQQCGILLGTLLLMLCTWMAHHSCMFLVKSASVSKRRTYAGLAFHAYGKVGKMMVETSMIGLMLGTCIAFYVVIGDLGSSFFARLFGLEVSEGFRVFLLFSVSLCIVLPLSLQRNMMAFIQSFSAMALMFYTVFMFVIVLSSFKHGLFSGQWLKHVSYIRWEGVFRCIPIYGMSFACQSQVLPTYDSLDDPSVKIMSSIFALSLNVVTTFYITVGFFGYVSFPETIAGNVLVNFPSNLVTEMIRVGFMMSVAVGFPMMILPCRQALNTLLFEQQQKDGTFTAGGYMPPLRFKILTLVVVFGTMLGGILIPNVETILGLTGATMGSLICLICPALIYKKIHKKGLASQFILGVGLLILVISTYTTLTVTEEPTQIKSELLERIDLKEEKDPEQINSQKSDEKAKVEQPGDNRDKPKLPPKNPEEEQIKGPIEGPQKEKDTKKQEEVQLDRPDQGDIAVPVGEAHRHEPPIPQDEVAVDEKKDQGEREEKKESVVDINSTEKKDKQQINLEKEPEIKDQAEANKGINEPVPQKPPQEVNDPNKQQLVNPPTPRLKEQPPFKDLEGIIKDLAVPVEIKKNAEIAEEKDNNDFANPVKAIENPPIKDEKNEQIPGDPGKESHVEPKAEDNQAEAGKAELLDHAFLLQVIKEQQVQQKRLLDQQEKLLEVIKEQHMEIHQQKGDEDQQDKLEGNIADKNKEELKAEARVAQKPLEGDKLENVGEVNAKVDKPAVEEHVVVVEKEQNPALNQVVKGNVPDVKKNDHKIEAPKINVEEVKVPISAGKHKKQSVQENLIHQQDVDQGASDNYKQREKAVAANKDYVLGHIIQQETANPIDPITLPDLQDKLGKLALHQTEPKQKPVKIAGIGEKKLGAVQEEKILVQKGQEAQADKVIQDNYNPVPDHGLHENNNADAPATINVEAKKEHIEKPKDGAVLEHDEGKQNRDLKLQNDMDLRRKKRDLALVQQENNGAQIISFHPVPNLKVNDLRGALEARLNQMVDGGLQVVQSRKIKQLIDEEKNR
ncbi:putative sodium-coupled neutral amino acid transporter 10 [Xenopus laevis]|uniref:Putative sodium-coupled neutral amino acid transporter 10 n=1 Tax=Xenopus laevis TaxID=8355 RepID=S38AA_XENLA|nr:putative sodium-coupled neutral amino acid transporter 10 [Xenopus laevis]Q6PCF9.1 RecName: Full=Putative sodium-coupled neutral amino acid transporter 10; AltName: Full=Solute carrier family 38 member 10 [Xenopus laevis]AAH59341.1 Slc38a10 protein [Xenopus laevis]